MTICQTCRTSAAEWVCHTCKTPRPGFDRSIAPAPAEAVCFDVFDEIDRATALFYPPKKRLSLFCEKS